VNISIFGLGYVGCVTAACLAQEGHKVVGVDVSFEKAELLASGKSPVVETNLEEMVAENVRSGHLQVLFDSQAAVAASDISLICVGTPSSDNGSLKLHYVEKVCREIGEALSNKHDYHVVVVRSTVLPGTVEEKLVPLLERHSKRRAGFDFGVCMNPEFLREGSAINDYYHPSMILVGEFDQRSGDLVQELYESIDAPIFRTEIRVAEMVKYASNAFHALKIVFANEIGNLCQAQCIDGREVMDIFVQDRHLNISASYLKPGFAFGGSCLPKDLRALLYKAKQLDVECNVLSAILPSNQKQIEHAVKLVEKQGRKNVGILGLSFKPGTDDLRESPAVVLAETLLGKGYQIRIFDEEIQLSRLVGTNKSFLEKEIPHIASLLCSSIEQLVSMSDVVVITSGNSAFTRVQGLMTNGQLLIDLDGTTSARARAICEGVFR
jgi:GDP-mannose 6-dehydrogenase